MSRVVIHAGLPKTATSFLQEKVFPYLSDEECVFNPTELNRILIALSKQVQSGCELNGEHVAMLKEQVDHELSQIDAPVLLLSVEGLMPLHCGGYENTETILKVLSHLFPGAEIVVFLREQLAWFRSAYSFCLVSKYVLPFDQFVCRDGDGQLSRRSQDGLGVCVFDYDYDRIRQAVECHFQSVHFFSFEDLFSDRQESSLQRLASILQVPALKVGSSVRVNKGLDESLMVRISNVAGCMPFRDRWKSEYLYTKYSKIHGWRKVKYLYLRKSGQLAMALAKAIHGLLGQTDARLFSEEERRQVQEHYRQSNTAFWRSLGRAPQDTGGDLSQNA